MNNNHMVEENYTALFRAVCNQAVEDTIRAIKHTNRILLRYENEVNKIRDIRNTYDITVKGSSDEESLKEITKDLNKQMRRLNELQTFFEGEWFYALNGMGLTSQKVCRAITKNVIGREFNSLTDYIEFINNRLEEIQVYVVEKSADGISVVYLE